jgi:hypothetical protein
MAAVTRQFIFRDNTPGTANLVRVGPRIIWTGLN